MSNEYDECGKKIEKTKNCKFFHHEPYMTPNNFDLEFDYSGIPVNIDVESNIDLTKRMQRTLPLSKIVHLKLDSKKSTQYNELNINTFTRLKFVRINEVNGEIVNKENVVVKLK